MPHCPVEVARHGRTLCSVKIFIPLSLLSLVLNRSSHNLVLDCPINNAAMSDCLDLVCWLSKGEITFCVLSCLKSYTDSPLNRTLYVRPCKLKGCVEYKYKFSTCNALLKWLYCNNSAKAQWMWRVCFIIIFLWECVFNMTTHYHAITLVGNYEGSSYHRLYFCKQKAHVGNAITQDQRRRLLTGVTFVVPHQRLRVYKEHAGHCTAVHDFKSFIQKKFQSSRDKGNVSSSLIMIHTQSSLNLLGTRDSINYYRGL